MLVLHSVNGPVVELVGPGGSGKSTVIAEFEKHGVFPILKISDARSLGARGRAASAVLRLAAQYRLRPAQALSLFRKCCSVETGLSLIERAPAGSLVVDEGPVRTLCDTKCSSWRERAAWWAYAKQVLIRLSRLGKPMLIVELRLDEAERRQRYRARTSNAPTGAWGIVDRLLNYATRRRTPAPIPTIRRAVTVFAAKHLSHLVTQERIEVSATETPTEVAGRIMSLAAVASNDWQPVRRPAA